MALFAIICEAPLCSLNGWLPIKNITKCSTLELADCGFEFPRPFVSLSPEESMTANRVFRTITLAGALGVAPMLAPQAQTVCTTGSLVVCVGFTFGIVTPTQYTLRVDFLSSTAGGSLYQFGLTDGASNFGLTGTGSVVLSAGNNSADWSFGCTGLLSGNDPDDVCVQGPTGGGALHTPGFAMFTFTSNAAFLGAGNTSLLTAQAHIQSFANLPGCSVKLSTSSSDFSTAGQSAGSFDAADCGTTTTPEPAGILLMGSGLVGIGGFLGLRRRTTS